MAPNDRKKLGLSLPIDPRWKGFDGSSSSSASNMTSPSQRGTSRSPRPNIPPPPPRPEPALEREEAEQLQRLESAPRPKKLAKQRSMEETRRDIAWEKRRKQFLRQEKRRMSIAAIPTEEGEDNSITDEDLSELRGSIELGFGFTDEAGQKLSDTLPALDFYLAVNRQLSLSPVSTPRSTRMSPTSSNGGQSSTVESPSSASEDSWKICGPGDSPKQVKAKLRHWAQAVACSVMQSL